MDREVCVAGQYTESQLLSCVETATFHQYSISNISAAKVRVCSWVKRGSERMCQKRVWENVRSFVGRLFWSLQSCIVQTWELFKKMQIICSSESDLLLWKQLGCGKKEVLVLAVRQIPMKHSECVHTWLLPVLVALFVNTAASCYSHVGD